MFSYKNNPLFGRNVTIFHETADVVAPAEGQLSCATQPVLLTVQCETVKSSICNVIKSGYELFRCAPNLPSNLVVG